MFNSYWSSDLLQKLRSFGMTDDDQEKLFALKNFISKTAVSKRRSANIAAKLDLESTDTLEHSNMMSLKLLGFTPRTIFLSPPPFHHSLYNPSAGVNTCIYVIMYMRLLTDLLVGFQETFSRCSGIRFGIGRLKTFNQHFNTMWILSGRPSKSITWK